MIRSFTTGVWLSVATFVGALSFNDRPLTTTTSTTSSTTSTSSTTVPTASAHDALQADLAEWDSSTTTSTSTSTTTTTLPWYYTASSQSVDTYIDTPCQQWLDLAVQVGWPNDPEALDTLGRVMWRETRCINLALDDHRHNGHDYGLMQINEVHTEWVEEMYGVDFTTAMLDPARNLHFAWMLYSTREAKNKCGWQPWSFTCNQ